MPARTPSGSAAIDRLDRQILHALTIAPRIPFARLAAVLQVSEQTVARRYQRMRTHGIARVFGLADYTQVPGATSWMVSSRAGSGSSMGCSRSTSIPWRPSWPSW